METQVISLLRSRPLVTVSEAACVLNVSAQEVRTTFASIVSSNAGAYALLAGTAVEEAAAQECATTTVTMQKVESTSDEAAAYALLALTYPQHVAASAVPVGLRPGVSAGLRAYPVVTRAAMASRPDDAPRAPPAFTAFPKVEAVSPVLPTAPAVVKVEAVAPPAPATPPQLPVVAVVNAVVPASPALRATETQQPVARAPVEVRIKQEAPEEVAPVPAVVAAPPVVTKAPRKPTIFDKMKEAAATKRQREGDEAPAKAKKTPAARPKKEPKTENTTSLAKLARASKKKAGAAPTPAPASTSFLDEDDGDAMNGFSNSEASTRDEASVIQEEAPVLDVVEVSASNDDVILCDDAPPLAFRPAEPLPSAIASTTQKKEATAKKSAASAADSGASQSTLGSFFNAAVVEFQKSYTRDVQTEMKVENGEYICMDVPCYKHKKTGEVISEEEYHRHTAQLVRSHEASPDTAAQKSAGAAAETSNSPAAKSAPRSPNDKTEKAKTSSAPARTLQSFFKPTA